MTAADSFPSLMKRSLASLLVVAAALMSVSCSTEEADGRKYYSPGANPVQGRMGVQFKRVAVPGAPAPEEGQPQGRVSDGSLFGRRATNEPPGLLDRNVQPDEPGAQYWMHGQQSPNPVQSRMGVRVSRKKKEATQAAQ